MCALSDLHQAVINGDEKALFHLLSSGADVNAKDAFGFTPLELAKILGLVGCQRLLGFNSDHYFDKETGLTYRPFLKFSSYDDFRNTLIKCPYIIRPCWLAVENHAITAQFFDQIWSGEIAKVSIEWIDDTLGYGLIAKETLEPGAFVGIYTGVVRALPRPHLAFDGDLADAPNDYCLHYPTRFWSASYLTVDALKEGNALRFMNHSDSPNVEPKCGVDRQLLHMIFVASRRIEMGEQLMFNYGPDYWRRRAKI